MKLSTQDIQETGKVNQEQLLFVIKLIAMANVSEVYLSWLANCFIAFTKHTHPVGITECQAYPQVLSNW